MTDELHEVTAAEWLDFYLWKVKAPLISKAIPSSNIFAAGREDGHGKEALQQALRKREGTHKVQLSGKDGRPVWAWYVGDERHPPTHYVTRRKVPVTLPDGREVIVKPDSAYKYEGRFMYGSALIRLVRDSK